MEVCLNGRKMELVAPDDTMPFGWLHITSAEMAQEIFDNRIRNRRVSRAYAAGFAYKMQGGSKMQGCGWHEGPPPLVFDTQGRLIDGQNRMLGVILAGRPIRMMAVWNADKELLSRLDRNRVRSLADSLQVRFGDPEAKPAVVAPLNALLRHTISCDGDGGAMHRSVDSVAEEVYPDCREELLWLQKVSSLYLPAWKQWNKKHYGIVPKGQWRVNNPMLSEVKAGLLRVVLALQGAGKKGAGKTNQSVRQAASKFVGAVCDPNAKNLNLSKYQDESVNLFRDHILAHQGRLRTPDMQMRKGFYEKAVLHGYAFVKDAPVGGCELRNLLRSKLQIPIERSGRLQKVAKKLQEASKGVEAILYQAAEKESWSSDADDSPVAEERPAGSSPALSVN